MALPTTYNVNAGIRASTGAYGCQFSKTIYSATLVGAAEATLTVPGLSAMGNINSSRKVQWMAVFSYATDVDVYVAINDTAAAPAAGTLDPTTSCLNPNGRIVNEGDVISCISTNGGDMTIELYYIQEG